MTIDNLKLQTKTLLPLALMAFVVLYMVGFGSFNLSSMSGTASDIIERRDVAVTRLMRASREMVMAPYGVFGSLIFDGNGQAGQRAIEGFPKAVTNVVMNMDEAAKLMPLHASEINTLKGRFLSLMEKAKKPLQIGKDTPGLEDGSKLKPNDLDLMAEGAHDMTSIDAEMRELVGRLSYLMNPFSQKMLKCQAIFVRDLPPRFGP